MGRYNVKEEELTIRNMIRYDAIKDDEGIEYRDYGDYLMMMVPMKNKKLHDTYRLYYRADGTIERIVGDSGNSGFVGTKYF